MSERKDEKKVIEISREQGFDNVESFLYAYEVDLKIPPALLNELNDTYEKIHHFFKKAEYIKFKIKTTNAANRKIKFKTCHDKTVTHIVWGRWSYEINKLKINNRTSTH